MNKFFTPGKISENIRKTPEGYLLCLNVPIARTGMMEYGEGETPLETGRNGKVLVGRDPEEVFRPATIASFEGKPITIKHPENFVTPENWKDLAKGTIQNVRRGSEKDEDGEESLIADLLITDEYAIELVNSGLREVSCGYEAEYEQTGDGKGKQTRIVGNHLALVEEGRAGASYAINDQKGKTMFEELIEQIKALSKTADKALAKDKARKVRDEDGGMKTPQTKEGDTEMKTFDKDSLDELSKAVKDFSEKLGGLMKGKEDKEEKSEDDDEEGMEANPENAAEGEILERVKMLEKAVAKMLGAASKDEDKDDEDDNEEDESAAMDDDEEDDEDESEDSALEDMEGSNSQKKNTGDTAALVEILAPGLDAKQKNVERKALKQAYGTKDGRAAILSVTGGKKPNFDKDNVIPLFRATAQILKFQRGTGLERTRDGNALQDALKFGEFSASTDKMTPEQLNKLNEEFWNSRKK